MSGTLVSNCVFRGNYSDTYGGGAYIGAQAHGTDMKVSNCQFISNTNRLYGGGGLYFKPGMNSILENCEATGNVGPSGAGFYFMPNVSYASNCVVRNCTVSGNKIGWGTTGTRYGGGMYVAANIEKGARPVLVENCTVTNNDTDSHCWRGGGIYADHATIRNSLVARNSASSNSDPESKYRGGGIYLLNGLVESCTIVDNEAGEAGGGLYIEAAGSGTNNIVYFNAAPSDTNYYHVDGNVGLAYSCVTPLVLGIGNTDSNPQLVDVAGGNYRSRQGSPVYNTGTHRSWMYGAVDLDGNKRIQAGIVDMGAYELPPMPGTAIIVQ